MSDEREKQLDEYEARFGKYVLAEDRLGSALHLQVGCQSFALAVVSSDDDEGDKPERVRWYRRMICNALHNLVEAETKIEGQ